MNNNSSSPTREERYEETMNPFSEYLPDIWPSNSDAYLTLLATKMRAAGLTEEKALLGIQAGNPFEIDAAHVAGIVHAVFAAPADRADGATLTKAQSKALAQREFFSRRYELRNNMVIGVTEYRERKRLHTNWRPVDEIVINSMAVSAQEEGIDMWDRDVKRFLKSNRVCPYNPFDEFIASLPKWDKHPRIDKLFRRIPVDDEQWYALAHKWFLGMVALWMHANRRKGNELMLILVGEQGTGKSTFARSLLPKELETLYTENFSLSDRRKALLMLTRYGLINFDEADRLTESQQPTLKNMLQLPMVDEFKPYASRSTQQERYASLMGTSNSMGVIADLTGSRRYLCAKVTGRIDTRKAINYGQLYAEAVWEIRHGRPYWLNSDEETALMQRNSRFVRMPAEAETFDTLFGIATPDMEGARWMYASEINKRLHPTLHKPMTHGELCRFKDFMMGLNAVTRRAEGGIQYLVREKDAKCKQP